MGKKVRGYCNIQDKYETIEIDVIPSNTSEGTEYAKAGINCEYNNANHTCKRNDCPIWINFRPQN